MKPPIPGTDKPLKTYTQEINGELYRVTEFSGNRKMVEPLRTVDPDLWMRVERNRTMRGISRRKTGG